MIASLHRQDLKNRTPMPTYPHASGGRRRWRNALSPALMAATAMACGGAGESPSEEVEVVAQHGASAQPARDTTAPLVLSSAERTRRVDDFVQQVRAQWGYQLNAADYDVQTSGRSVYIAQKGESAPTLTATRSKDGASVAVTGAITMPTAAPPAATDAIVLGEPAWGQPHCLGAQDEDGVGQMLSCFEMARLFYDTETRANYAVRFKGGCSPKPWDTVPRGYELDECAVSTWLPYPTPSKRFWNAIDPMSTKTLPDCRDIPLGFSFQGFSVGTTIKTCEKLVPDFLVDVPGNMIATWKGNAWTPDDKRETGFVMSFGIPYGERWSLYYTGNYKYSSCWLPGSLPPIDICGP